jgi:hypothetical protein
VPSSREEFVRGLAQGISAVANGTRTLSPRLINGLLPRSGEQLDAYLATG